MKNKFYKWISFALLASTPLLSSGSCCASTKTATKPAEENKTAEKEKETNNNQNNSKEYLKQLVDRYFAVSISFMHPDLSIQKVDENGNVEIDEFNNTPVRVAKSEQEINTLKANMLAKLDLNRKN
ncbi:hypothetical protein [Mycoplasmopsis glycophila]|uniref:Lipoprotein n=1 Tax=Mycoplasmopsis glycophila TaxID=171285 RepID=A0A449AVH9_9BACT|nr:hypothetical protein [Mycoplasmopsis glycophila]VEU70532.1 Uncharacterised protein [Mycoplasmopsis glycophila]